MPTVPRYQTSVTEQALPQSRQQGASSDLFQPNNLAADISRGLQGLGNAVDVIQERQDTTEFLNLETELNNQYLSQASELKKSRLGVNAYGVTKDVDAMVTESVRKLNDSTKSERVKALLSQSASKLKQAAFRDFDGFENTQTKAAEDAAFEANIGMIKERVASNPNPDAVALGEAEIRKRNTAYGVQRGWSPELLANKNDGDVSALHVNAIRTLINESPELAQQYFISNKDKILGSQQDDVEKLLKPVLQDYKAEQARDYVIQNNLSEVEGRKYIMDNYKGDEETKALSLLNVYHAEAKAAKAEQEKAVEDDVWKRVAAGQPIPRDVWATLDGKTQVQVQDYKRVQADRAEAKAKAREADKVKTDWNRYLELRNLAMSDPKSFRNINMQGELSRLAPAQIEQLVDLQAKADDPNKIKAAATTSQQISSTAGGLGLKGDKLHQFESVVYGEIEAQQKTAGKELSFDEKQKIIDRNLIEGEVVKNWAIDKSAFKYEVVGTPDANKFVPSDDALSKKFFERKGRQPTKAELKLIKSKLGAK